MIRTISSSSSVEVVSDVSPTSSTDEVTQRMTELVQERIASLGLKPGKQGDAKFGKKNDHGECLSTG